MTKIRPYVRKFHSSEYLNALATGEICLVVGFSGDIKQAQKRAAEAKGSVAVGYTIPKEGAQMWFDNFAIPKDAPNSDEAHALINYLLKPEVAAKNTNFISYANGNLASQKFVDKSILDDPTIYPDAAVMAKLYTITAHDQNAAPDQSAVDADQDRQVRGGLSVAQREAPVGLADAIARQTASDVSGMSMSVTPSGDSASRTALTIAAGAAIAPASPQPLAPRGLCVQGWLSSSSDSMSGRSGR